MELTSLTQLYDFLPHFHYNKDWNFSKINWGASTFDAFLPHFHYNKDWNLKNNVLPYPIMFLLTPLPL